MSEQVVYFDSLISDKQILHHVYIFKCYLFGFQWYRL